MNKTIAEGSRCGQPAGCVQIGARRERKGAASPIGLLDPASPLSRARSSSGTGLEPCVMLLVERSDVNAVGFIPGEGNGARLAYSRSSPHLPNLPIRQDQLTVQSFMMDGCRARAPRKNAPRFFAPSIYLVIHGWCMVSLRVSADF